MPKRTSKLAAFIKTVPGVITGLTALLVAITGLVAAINGLPGLHSGASDTQEPTSGAGSLKLPEVTGHDVVEAKDILAGLKLTTVLEAKAVSDGFGKVIAQQPAAGQRVAPASLVTLTVGAYSMDNFVGSTRQAATDALRRVRVRLSFDASRVTSTGAKQVPFNTIIKQTPDSGKLVMPGETVSFDIEGHWSIVPPVTTLQLAAAREALGKLQLRNDGEGDLSYTTPAAVHPGDPPEFQVLEQNPAPGTVLPWGSHVTLHCQGRPNPNDPSSGVHVPAPPPRH